MNIIDDLPQLTTMIRVSLQRLVAHAQFLREAMVTDFVNHPRAYVTMQDQRGWTPLHTVGDSDRRYTKQAKFYDAKECEQDGTPRLYRGLDLAAAEGMFGEPRPATVRHDANQYTPGNIGETQNRHCLLIKRRVLGIIGASRGMQSSFPSIRLGLMVGIGGGHGHALPWYDIRLGHAVVGRLTNTNGGVIRYDFWKVVQFLKHVSKKIEINPKIETTHNYRDTDHGRLFEASYNHPKGSTTRQLRCGQI